MIALYAQGNSVEDVEIDPEDLLIEISVGKISQITDNVLPEIEAWKTRVCNHFTQSYILTRSILRLY
ncbi:MAG: transposase [Saprospiraceae bacterium]|nr:transposase [Saprospiraceae bacterium]